MVSPLTIYQVAKIYVDHFGEMAFERANKRVQIFQDIGNPDAQQLWEQIGSAIIFLQSHEDTGTCH